MGANIFEEDLLIVTPRLRFRTVYLRVSLLFAMVLASLALESATLAQCTN